MKLVKSVFALTDEQRLEVEQALALDAIIAMVRPGYNETPQYVGGFQDFFIHFYYEDLPLFDSELALIYMTRYEIIQAFAKTATVKAMKTMTAGHLEYAMLAAIVCTNIYIDIFQQVIRPALEPEHLQFHETFAYADWQHFFNKKFQKIESYPTLFVRVQSEIIKQFWHYIRTEQETFEQNLLKAKQFLQTYVMTEMRLFSSLSSIR